MAITLISLALIVLLFVIFEGEGGDVSDTDPERSLGLAQGGPDRPGAGEGSVPVIQLVDGEPVGGPARLRFEEGERVRFVVGGRQTDRVHVHGYDISVRVAPGKPAELSFPASITGVFEVELERAGSPIAELVVEP